ncbi:MAG: c-type cytochrome [Saprospiraceae bacterium]|nr:c-type cytochrome [Saprospiraceae bacterium]
MSGSDFKIKPEQSLFELTGRSSGGYELAMDNWGTFYGTHNLHHISSLVFPGHYIEGLTLNPRNTLLNISDHEENGLARVYPIGEQETRVNHPEQSGYFSGACGITHYGGGAYPDEYDGSIFVNDVVLNLVHHDYIYQNGPVMSASRGTVGVDFLASTDRSFRPVNSTVGPDGALYIVDFYRKVIEHPEWIPDDLEVKMDLDAGKEKGRIYRIKSREKNLLTWNYPGNALNRWCAALTSNNQWQRLTAQRWLVEKNMAGTEKALIDLYHTDVQPKTKLHILYTLQELGATEIQNILVNALGDKDDHVREHAIRLAEPYFDKNQDLREKILSMSNNENVRIQMQVALSLSTLPNDFNEQILEALKSILRKQINDPYVRMACMSASHDIVLPLALFIINEPQLISQEGAQQMLAMLATHMAQQGNSSELLSFIGLFKEKAGIDPALWVTVLNGYNNGGLQVKNTDLGQWAAVLNKIESEADLQVIGAAWNLRKTLGLSPSSRVDHTLKMALTNLTAKEVTEERLIESIKILSYGKKGEVAELLLDKIDTRNPTNVQQAALDALLSLESTDITSSLVDRWSTLSPTIRKRVTDLLIYDSSNHELLFSSLESGKLNLNEFNFDLERRRRLLNTKDENTQKRAAALFSDSGVVQRKEAIEKMKTAMTLQGHEKTGLEIFEAQCATCHRFGTKGNQVGPDLTEISRKSKETLIHDILDPNAGADPVYINHIAEMNDGQVFSGIVENETDDVIFLRMMGGVEKNLAKNQIKSFNSTGLSLMPEGLEGVMTPQDLADLLAFLQQKPQ